MSVGAIIALTVLAGVTGAAVGASVTVFALRTLQARRALQGAYARWLASRLAASRAYLALATALRAVRCEGSAAARQLRTVEVQRARTQWYKARHQLDLAVARLIAFKRDGTLRAELARVGANERAVFQRAVDGGLDDLDTLVRRLRKADQHAIELFDAEVVLPRRSRVQVDVRIDQLVSLLRGIVESWRRP